MCEVVVRKGAFSDNVWYCLSVIQADNISRFLEFKHLSQNVMQMFIQLGVSDAMFVVVIAQNLSVSQ